MKKRKKNRVHFTNEIEMKAGKQATISNNEMKKKNIVDCIAP